MPLLDKDAGLVRDLLLVEDDALHLLVRRAEGAVEAFVAAEVRDVEGGEDDDAAAVDCVLHMVRGGEHFVQQFRVRDRQQGRGLGDGQTGERPGLREDVPDFAGVGGFVFRQQLRCFGVVDECV